MRRRARERARRVADAARTRRLDRARHRRARCAARAQAASPPLFEEEPLPLRRRPDNPSTRGWWGWRRGRRGAGTRRSGSGGAATSWASRATSSRATSATWRRRIRRSCRNPCGRCATSWAAARSPATTSRSGRRRARRRRGGASWRSRGRRSGVGGSIRRFVLTLLCRFWRGRASGLKHTSKTRWGVGTAAVVHARSCTAGLQLIDIVSGQPALGRLQL